MLNYFICLDVDRTILRSTVLFDDYIVPTLQAVAQKQARDEDERAHRTDVIETLQRDMVENLGKSFDFLAAYNERVDESNQLNAEQLAENVLERIRMTSDDVSAMFSRLMAPGTEELLRALEQLPSSRWGFVTSGGVQTQTAKLLLLRELLRPVVGEEFRAKILSTEHKARDVDSVWRQTDGKFLISVDLAGEDNLYARQVIVIDDKQKNLTADNQQGITSILVQQLDMPDDGLDRASLFEVVQQIHNLDN